MNHGPKWTLDVKLATQPATRWELWEAMYSIRSMVHEVQSAIWAARRGDDEAALKALDGYIAAADKLEKYADNLIGVRKLEGDDDD